MPKKRRVGRPAGEESVVVNVRVPVSLIKRLDRYIDKMEAQTGVTANRGMVMRNTLKAFLTRKKY